jgi:hypothetical protein
MHRAAGHLRVPLVFIPGQVCGWLGHMRASSSPWAGTLRSRSLPSVLWALSLLLHEQRGPCGTLLGMGPVLHSTTRSILAAAHSAVGVWEGGAWEAQKSVSCPRMAVLCKCLVRMSGHGFRMGKGMAVHANCPETVHRPKNRRSPTSFRAVPVPGVSWR